MAPAYPAGSGKARAKAGLDGLGLQLDLIERLGRLRFSRVLAGDLAAALPRFVAAAAADTGLSPADYLQTRVALGELCALHLTELGGDDIHGRFCTGCEFGWAEARHRNQPVIPFPAGEVIDPRELHGEDAFSDMPGAFA